MAKIIIKAYKFSFKPSKIQTVKLNDTLYLCQQLYNAALAERVGAYQINRVSINYQAQQNQLPEIKVTNPEYKNIHSQVVQNILKRVDLAFQAFFQRIKRKEKAGFPRFRSVGRYDSFTFPQSGFSLTGNKLTLSKLGSFKLKLSRAVVGKVKTCTIKRECGKWFAVFSVETLPEVLPKTGAAVGVDMGISSFLTLSDGSRTENFKYHESAQTLLRVAARRVALRVKGSNGRKKAALMLRKIHQKIKNQRADFQHKTTTFLVKTYDFIAIENLSVAGMSKGRLAKQIKDASWGSFFNMLGYKAENAGRQLIKVNPAFTSQTCFVCGHCEKANRQTQAIFDCVKCHHKNNADINAAQNILRLGKSALGLKLNNSSCLPKESLTITVSV